MNPFAPATELLAGLRDGSVSSRELLDLQLERIEGPGAALNAVVTLDVERARKRAEQADAARARGERWGPLHGLPMTVKDCFETEGLRTTCGVAALREHIPLENATAVQRLVDAGAVIFGKTNTPAWTMDWQTHNEVFGTTRNPWHLDRSPGGSSGGSAAAVAAGLSALELGSDIGGSIRIPAHCCGIYGHKPSWGLVPLRGHIPGLPGSRVETDLNVAGPLARSAPDLELALEVLAGPAEEAARAWRLALPPPRAERLAELRVAAWFDDPACRVAGAVRARLEATADALRRAGARVDDTARPPFSLADAVELYQRMLAPLTVASMSDEQFAAVVGRTAAPGIESPVLRDFLEKMGVRHRDWLALHQRRELMRAAWADFFRSHDVLLCPASPLPAIPHDHSEPAQLRSIEVDGQARTYIEQFVWTGAFGVALLPASVAPVGCTPEGLPVGVQIVGPYLEDRTPLAAARLLAAEIGGYQPPPARPPGGGPPAQASGKGMD